MRDFLLFLHIFGVATWLGGGLYAVYSRSALTRLEPAAVGPAMEGLKKVEDRFFGPASGLVLLSGVGLVLTSEAFGWADGFVLIGLGAFILLGVLNSTVGKKSMDRLLAASASGSGLDQARRSWLRSSVWDYVVLAVVLWAMITKLGA